jgi:hypothetical protein
VPGSGTEASGRLIVAKPFNIDTLLAAAAQLDQAERS